MVSTPLEDGIVVDRVVAQINGLLKVIRPLPCTERIKNC